MNNNITISIEDENDRKFIAAIERIKSKNPVDIYLLLKDLNTDLKSLYHDEQLTMTRSQFACLNRANNIVKELLK